MLIRAGALDDAGVLAAITARMNTSSRDPGSAAKRRRLALAALLALALAVGLGWTITLTGTDRGKRPLSSSSPFAGSLMPAGVPAPEFALRDQDGQIFDSRRLRGRVALVTFVYATCTDSCGPQVQLVRGALDDVGRDIPVVAISADPRTDTPQRAKRFLLEQRMTGRMRFVLGSRQALARVYRGFFVQPQSDSGEHHARIVLLDRRGLQRVGYNLANTVAEDIAHDIRVLEREPR